MQDELDRARTRLELTIPGTNQPARPYYIQYRVLDLEVRTIVAEFGALVSSTRGRNRIMSVDVRVGNNNLDSSNFITDEGFSGFLGSTGTVGIDRDYDSLRQDLWLATDQAFKAAVENYSKKQAFMSRLAKAPSIPDFSPATPTVMVDPLHGSGLDHAKLGAGSPDGFRRLAPVPAVVQLARHVSPDLHHELSAQYRRNQDSRQSQPGGHRSQPRNRIGRRHGPAQFLCRLSPPSRPVARGRRRSKGTRKGRRAIDHAPRFASRSRLRWPGAVRSACGRFACLRKCWGRPFPGRAARWRCNRLSIN